MSIIWRCLEKKLPLNARFRGSYAKKQMAIFFGREWF
jgi:hypothetical protein